MPKLTMMELTENKAWDGFSPVQRGADWDKKRVHFAEFLESLTDMSYGRRLVALEEAMSTSDFPYLFGDTIDKKMVANFKTQKSDLQQIMRKATLPNFLTVKRFRMDGLAGRLQNVPEMDAYHAAELSEDQVSYAILKWGKQVGFSWEAWLNDDIGAFSDIAQRLADAARATEDYLATSILVNSSGPITANFNTVGSAVLSIAALEAGVEAMDAYTDPDSSEPVETFPVYLVVPPALRMTALRILNADAVVIAGTTDAQTPNINSLKSLGLKLIIDPWLPIVNTTNGSTNWYLFTEPSNLAFGEIGRLRGHETPEIFQKMSDQTRVGGGASSPFDGSFDNDSIEWKVRHCVNAVALNKYAGYASTGA